MPVIIKALLGFVLFNEKMKKQSLLHTDITPTVLFLVTLQCFKSSGSSSRWKQETDTHCKRNKKSLTVVNVTKVIKNT